MKKILAILLSLLTLLSCGLLSACSAEKTQPDTLDTETVWETVSEAYIYAFPLVLTDATKTLSTNTDGTMTGRAPINQFNHAKKLADASFRTVVMPNVDILIIAPLLAPVADSFGIDPIQFGCIFVFTLAIGQATPPFGACLFVSSSISGHGIMRLGLLSIPFVLVLLLVVILTCIFPDLATLLPSLMAA